MNSLNTLQKTPLAALSGTVPANTPVAVLNRALLAADNNGWYQLLPAGYFSAKDGRPADVPGGKWYLDATVAATLIARNAALTSDRPVDYEHQTLNAEKNGQPAPAAGRFNGAELQWRDGSGLWVKPRWTPRAQRYLDDREYIYLSAVFPYDANTGHPLWIHSIALTNDPGLDGLHALTSLKAGSLKPQENSMDPILLAILKALGIQVTDDKKPEQAAVLAALKAVQDKAATADVLATQLAALKATPPQAKPDPSQFVPIAALTDLQAQIAVLQAGQVTGELETLLANGKADGRITANMEAWARELGQQNLAALKSFLENAAPIAALTSTQTKGKDKPDKSGDESLTEAELEAAKLTGKTPKEYAALKASLKA